MSGKISVVIPIYNVEKYLPQCIDSIVNQTYKNLQIILVDDGSTDSCGKICDEYAEKDNRITVVHQKNAGAGAAKNSGLDLINGDYFSMIDSDDFVDTQMYEKMMYQMKMNHADVVQCMFNYVFVDDTIKRKYKFVYNNNRAYSSKEYLYEMLYDWTYAIFCNKLFKTSLLMDARFPVGRSIDDEFFTYKVVANANRIVNMQEPFINYRMRKSSVMKDTNSHRLINDRLDCFVERLGYINAKVPTLSKDFYNHLSDLILYYINQTDKESELFKRLTDMSKEYPIKQKSIYVKIRQKIKTNKLIQCDENIGENKLLFD